MSDEKPLDDDAKDLFEAELTRYDEVEAQSYVVLKTNWSANAQEYMRPHIITAIDTGSLSQAAKNIRTAHLNKYGGTVSVVLMKGTHAWASKTRFYFYAKYSGVYIGIWSSD